jgi:hypothetical protein
MVLRFLFAVMSGEMRKDEETSVCVDRHVQWEWTQVYSMWETQSSTEMPTAGAHIFITARLLTFVLS